MTFIRCFHTYLTLPAAGFAFDSAVSDSHRRPLKTKNREPLKGEITSLAGIMDPGKGRLSSSGK